MDFTIHNYKHFDPADERRLDRIESKLDALMRKVNDIMATQAEVKEKLDALTADVADETTKIAGIEQVLDNLAGIIKKLQDDVKNADVPQAIVDQIDALGTAVSGNKQRIIDDINKNTPA